MRRLEQQGCAVRGGEGDGGRAAAKGQGGCAGTHSRNSTYGEHKASCLGPSGDGARVVINWAASGQPSLPSRRRSLLLSPPAPPSPRHAPPLAAPWPPRCAPCGSEGRSRREVQGAASGESYACGTAAATGHDACQCNDGDHSTVPSPQPFSNTLGTHSKQCARRAAASGQASTLTLKCCNVGKGGGEGAVLTSGMKGMRERSWYEARGVVRVAFVSLLQGCRLLLHRHQLVLPRPTNAPRQAAPQSSSGHVPSAPAPPTCASCSDTSHACSIPVRFLYSLIHGASAASSAASACCGAAGTAAGTAAGGAAAGTAACLRGRPGRLAGGACAAAGAGAATGAVSSSSTPASYAARVGRGGRWAWLACWPSFP